MKRTLLSSLAMVLLVACGGCSEITGILNPGWRVTTSVDEMTGARSAYATSPRVGPTERMDFPYGDTEAWMGFGCDRSSEWAYIGFSVAPNLVNDETQDGYSTSESRVRWDDRIEMTGFSQPWGETVLHFRLDAPAIANMQAANTALIEVAWYGQGTVLFEFSLRGSSAAIAEAGGTCN